MRMQFELGRYVNLLASSKRLSKSFRLDIFRDAILIHPKLLSTFIHIVETVAIFSLKAMYIHTN